MKMNESESEVSIRLSQFGSSADCTTRQITQESIKMRIRASSEAEPADFKHSDWSRRYSNSLERSSHCSPIRVIGAVGQHRARTCFPNLACICNCQAFAFRSTSSPKNSNRRPSPLFCRLLPQPSCIRLNGPVVARTKRRTTRLRWE